MSRRYRPFDPFEGRGPFEAGRDIRIPPVPRRFWGGVALFMLALLIFIVANPLVTFITQVEWYDALGLRGVYLTRLGLEWALGLAAFMVALLYLATNVYVAIRIRADGASRAVGIRQ